MKQKIRVTLDENHIYTCTTKIIARSNENDVSQIEITLDDCLCDYWVFIDFEKPDGTKVKTPKLEIVNNVAVYDIPNSLVDLNGTLKAQIVLQKENGEVWKSTIKSYYINTSINATDEILENKDFVSETQKVIEKIDYLEKKLEEILTIINGGELDELTISKIEDLIVSYFENKTVEEVER